MKHIYKFILIGIFSLSFISCDDDFLDKNPTASISSETFWKTKGDALMGLAGVYNGLYQYGYANGNYNFNRVDWDGMSDNCVTRYGHGNILNLSRGNIESTSGGMVSSIFYQSYKGIARCNNFLGNIDNVTMDETLKNQYIGEVLFLRAYYYWNLTEFYGGVPLYTESPTIESAKIKQSPKNVVVDQVIADLDKAIGYLPSNAYGDGGHAVKGSAYALKAKVLLHNEKWAEAAIAANEAKAGYSLSSNYADNYTVSGQSSNPEIMFSTKYLNPDRYAFYGPDVEWGWWGTLQPHQNLVDAYECTDGLPITESPLYDPTKPRLNRDPRLAFTIRFAADGELVGGTWDNGYASETGYYPKKYIEPGNAPMSYAVRSEQDFIHLRLADVLLMYAEAKNEASGPDASVYKAINDIRARVNMPALSAGLSKDQMREKIRYERRIELAFEGFRYLDIKRWKTAEDIIPTIVDPGGITRSFDPSKHYLFPIPQGELDVNPELDQNPGY